MDPVIILIKRRQAGKGQDHRRLRCAAWKSSRLRRLPTGAARDKILCGGYNGAMLPKCKGKIVDAGLTFSRFKARL